MTDMQTDAQSVVVERELAHPPEKVWRALTQPHLMQEWLAKTDFRPQAGHRFDLPFDWGRVDCEVLVVEPHRTLTYTWTSGALDSVVTWTLTGTEAGTRLRLEQTGFPAGEPRYLMGARMGWPRFFDGIETVLARPD
jgi:uncharacterized protein YndB with AHSA1/START domain